MTTLSDMPGRAINGDSSGANETEGASSEITKYTLAERSFDHTVDMDKYYDTKAGRTLAAMAFLTAASATLFGTAYSPDRASARLEQALTRALSDHVNSEALRQILHSVTESLGRPYEVFGLDWPLVFFSLYMLCVLLGAALYLGAIGPHLNIPAPWRKSEKRGIDSLLFFRMIASVDPAEWSHYWKDAEPSALASQMEDCFVYECRLIAEKANVKHELMSQGNVLFRLALAFWIALVAGLFSSTPVILWSALFSGWSALSAAFAITAWSRRPRQMGRCVLFAVVAGVLLVCIAITPWWVTG